VTDLEVKISRASVEAIERLWQAHGLSVTLKTTQSKYAGSIHWHLKKGRERGTLEATLWPSQNRFWFSMQDGRKGDWVMPAAHRMKAQLER
jgi:hypothetical protein